MKKIIRNYLITPRRGNKPLAQGIALGGKMSDPRPERAKALIVSNAFALSGRWMLTLYTQGDAPGYVLIGLSGRQSGTRG